MLNAVRISSENCTIINGRVLPHTAENIITPDVVIEIIKEGTSQSCYLKCSQNLVCELVRKRTSGQINCTYTNPNKYFITSNKYQFGYKQVGHSYHIYYIYYIYYIYNTYNIYYIYYIFFIYI